MECVRNSNPHLAYLVRSDEKKIWQSYKLFSNGQIWLGMTKMPKIGISSLTGCISAKRLLQNSKIEEHVKEVVIFHYSGCRGRPVGDGRKNPFLKNPCMWHINFYGGVLLRVRKKDP